MVGIRTFDLLNRGVGIFGLTGMDRLISFMIVRDMQVWDGNVFVSSLRLREIWMFFGSRIFVFFQ